MAKYSEQLQDIFERYRAEVSPDPVELTVVARWAIDQGHYQFRPVDLSTSLANDLANALREKKRVDKDGREYRAFIPVRNRAGDGLPLFKWGDIDDAPREHVEKHVQQERRSIVSDCYALQMKVDHYNAAHPEEEGLQLILDFTDDVAEAKIAKGIEDGEAA